MIVDALILQHIVSVKQRTLCSHHLRIGGGQRRIAYERRRCGRLRVGRKRTRIRVIGELIDHEPAKGVIMERYEAHPTQVHRQIVHVNEEACTNKKREGDSAQTTGTHVSYLY